MSLSIVTVNYNDSIGLEKTLKSIVKSDLIKSDLIKLFVIDGGSNDDSLLVINKYNHIVTSYISEKDNGIYDAMNKGLELCDSEFILFLNAGDYFNDEFCFDNFISVLGDDNYKNKVVFWRAKINANFDSWYYPPKKNCNIEKWLKKNLPNHQAMLFPKCFYKINRYDMGMKVISDADYKYRAIKEHGYIYIDKSFTTFELGGVSSQKLTWKAYKVRLKDFMVYANKHYNGCQYITEVLKNTGKYTVKLFLGVLISDNKYFKILRK